MFDKVEFANMRYSEIDLANRSTQDGRLGGKRAEVLINWKLLENGWMGRVVSWVYFKHWRGNCTYGGNMGCASWSRTSSG